MRLKENLRTFATLIERKGFWASLIFAALVAIVGFLLFGLAEPPSIGGVALTIPWKYVPAVIAFIGLGILYIYWLIDSATSIRVELKGITNLEALLDRLS